MEIVNAEVCEKTVFIVHEQYFMSEETNKIYYKYCIQCKNPNDRGWIHYQMIKDTYSMYPKYYDDYEFANKELQKINHGKIRN